MNGQCESVHFQENGHSVYDDQPAVQLLENTHKTPPARSRSRRKVRQWPYETKRRIVETTLAPGASVAVIARQNDVRYFLVMEAQSKTSLGKPAPVQ
jgi:transposase-like protein